MKSPIPFLVIGFILATIFVPVALEFSICHFRFLNCLKEFTIPAWVLLFSSSWLYHRTIISNNRHKHKYYEKIVKEKDSILSVAELKEYNRLEHETSVKLMRSESSIKSLEVVGLIAGILAGIIGMAVYFFDNNQPG